MKTIHLVANPLWHEHGILSGQEGAVVYPNLDTLIQGARSDLSDTLDTSQVLLYVSPQISCEDRDVVSLQSCDIAPKAIISTGTGVDHIQITDQTKHDLGLVINSMPYRSRYHTVLVTLSLLNHLYPDTLQNQRIGIIGTGIIGTGLRSSLTGVAQTVSSYATHCADFTHQKNTIGKENDIIIICTSLTQTNQNMITSDVLDSWLSEKTADKPLRIVNIARAAHIDPSAYPVIQSAGRAGILQRYSDVDRAPNSYFDKYVVLDPFDKGLCKYTYADHHEYSSYKRKRYFQQSGLPVLSHKLMGTAGAAMTNPDFKAQYEKYMRARMNILASNIYDQDTDPVNINRNEVKKYPFEIFLYP